MTVRNLSRCVKPCFRKNGHDDFGIWPLAGFWQTFCAAQPKQNGPRRQPPAPIVDPLAGRRSANAAATKSKKSMPDCEEGLVLQPGGCISTEGVGQDGDKGRDPRGAGASGFSTPLQFLQNRNLERVRETGDTWGTWDTEMRALSENP